MIDKNKIIKGLITIAVIFICVIGMSKLVGNNSLTLSEYAQQNPASTQTLPKESDEAQNNSTDTTADDTTKEILQNEGEIATISTLTGAILNESLPENQRISYTESFYYEPLSDNLRRYITGVSYPLISDETIENNEDSEPFEDDNSMISYDDLRYVHILHYDFDGNLAEGELICNEYIAQDLVEIFYELYLNEYRLEKVRLVDEYDGDENNSMAANNTSCFHYRTESGTTSLSRHALGLAVDINPLYNPSITYNEDGEENILPEKGIEYADRSANFPYKIDENDLCYKLFTEHGFTWGGHWNAGKNYQHFQKLMPK
uniref:M15 family metallopeptidase n=1 Tax=Acetatifactor sp. TaxID=1872090 RepID=UPI004057A5C4